ncbi:MAG: GNAT family N-acetyltransferase [Chloroflexota bacterium]
MTEPAAVVLRPATSADVDRVTTLFLACWRRSYAEVLPPSVIAVFDESSARALWTRALTTPRPGSSGIVAELPGTGVAGIVRLGEDPDEPGTGHIFSLYVDPDVQGAGVGGRLLSAAVERMRDAGRAQVTLWVFAANTSARAFYARHGFHPDGGERVEPEFGEPELRLRRDPA